MSAKTVTNLTPLVLYSPQLMRHLMPSRFRRLYSKFREELLEYEPHCQICQSRHTKQDPLHYHHLIPQRLVPQYQRGYQCTQGILLCRRCHPTEVAKQRKEFRRLDDNGDRIYPEDPFSNKHLLNSISEDLREQLIATWKREVKPPYPWL